MFSNMPILGKLIRFATKHFLFIVLVLGMSLLIFSHFKPFSDFLNGEIFPISGKLGEIILAGGVFSAIVKSNFFLSVIGRELEKTILSSTLFDGVDLESALARFLTLCYKKSLPRLAEKFDADLVKNTFPVANDWYVSSKYIEINVDWLDEKKEAVKLTQYMNIRYVPKDVETIVSHHAEYCPMMGNSIEDYKATFDDILVDNVSINEDAKKYVKEQTARKVILELSGNNEYEIVRHSTAIIELEKDPTLFSTAKTYTIHTDVVINVKADDIRVFFTEVGLRKPFEERRARLANQRTRDSGGDQGVVAPKGYRISKVYQGLILPEQGFMLVFARSSSKPPQPDLPNGKSHREDTHAH